METREVNLKKAKHLLSLKQLSLDEIMSIVRLGVDFSSDVKKRYDVLSEKIIGILFKKTSTRTRTSFSVGTLRLGGQIVSYDSLSLQENTGEDIKDTASILNTMLDGLVIRTAEPMHVLEQMSEQMEIPLINAMCAEEHPTQALADFSSIYKHFGKVENIKMIYLGEGNNTATALAILCSQIKGFYLELRTPEGYGLPQNYLDIAKKNSACSGATVVEYNNMDNLPEDIDIVYTTRWLTTGTEREGDNWMEAFYPFQVNSRLMQTLTKNGKEIIFMHDLPAHRGQEVTADVLEAPYSIVFQQAEMKLYSSMAVLEHCLT